MPARMKVAIMRLKSTSSTRLIEFSPGMIRSSTVGWAGPMTFVRLRMPLRPVISCSPRGALR